MREHRWGAFSSDHEDSSTISSPQSVKSKGSSKLRVLKSPKKKNKDFKKKSLKSKEKEGKTKVMEADREKERKGKKRHHKDHKGSKKVVKKLAKMEMSDLLNLKTQIESELKNVNKEEHSRDCANPEKKAVTLKKTVRFFGK